MALIPNDSANVSVGKPKVGGAIFVAPIGTTIPDDATTALDTAFANLGYASDSGVSKSASTASQSIKAWGGIEVLQVQTEYAESYKFTLIESQRIDAIKLAYGAENVTDGGEDGIVVNHNGNDRPRLVFVIEVILSNGCLRRIVIPNGKVTELGDVSYVDGEAIPYDVKIAALPDAAGNSSNEYITTPTNG